MQQSRDRRDGHRGLEEHDIVAPALDRGGVPRARHPAPADPAHRPPAQARQASLVPAQCRPSTRAVANDHPAPYPEVWLDSPPQECG